MRIKNVFIYTILIFNTITRKIPLKGSIELNYYYVDILIGSPSQKQSLIIDTGSHSIIFPCVQCQNCGFHQNPYFNQNLSQTFSKIENEKEYYGWKCQDYQNNQCKFHQSYIESSSYEGFYGIDLFIFEDEIHNDNYKAIFGCAQRETGFFKSQKVDGVLGLGVQSQLGLNPPNLINIEIQEKRINDNSFTICLGDDGGYLQLGNQNKIDYQSESVQTELVWDKFYKLQLNEISIDEIHVVQKLNINYDNQATIDTGTTFIFLNNKLFQGFSKIFQSVCGNTYSCYNEKYQNCYELINFEGDKKYQFYDLFPNITLFLENKPLILTPENYFFKSIRSTESIIVMCIGIKETNENVLGAVAFKNHELMIDIEQKQVSWKPKQCSNEMTFNIEDLKEIKYEKTQGSQQYDLSITLIILLFFSSTIIIMIKESEIDYDNLNQQQLKIVNEFLDLKYSLFNICRFQF